MLILIVFLIVSSNSATPNIACNPSVQTFLTTFVSPPPPTATHSVVFPKAFASPPKFAGGFAGFDINTNISAYQLGIITPSPTITATGITFVLRFTLTPWASVTVNLMFVNSTSQQFYIFTTSLILPVNTNGQYYAQEIFPYAIGSSVIPENNNILLAFNIAFKVSQFPKIIQHFRPGFNLEYGIKNGTHIWFSVQAIQHTIINSIAFTFVIIDLNYTNNLVYKYDHQYIYTTSATITFGTNKLYNALLSNSFYDQYCFMAGINSFVYDYQTAPSFTFVFPTMTLSSRHALTGFYAMNVTTLNLMVQFCIAPDVYYNDTNTCGSACPDHYYPTPPNCTKCHYTCYNCTTNVTQCAQCKDNVTLTFIGDICNCKTGYFDNGFLRCQQCNSTCVNCSINQNNCTVCHPGFYVNQTFCKQVCGDGILFNLACDDGGLLDGDGCNSSCMIQDNFTCLNGTTTTPSVCSYNQPFELTFVSSSQGNSNIVDVSLLIFPSMPQFVTLNFSQYLTINLYYLSMKHTYNNGSLNLTITFSQPLNTSYGQLLFTFNPPISSSDNFMWKPSSVIAPYGTQTIIHFQISYFLSNILKTIFIVIVALSLFGILIIYRKSAALQFIMTLQIIPLSTSYIDSNHNLINSFNYLHQIGISGWNAIFNDSPTNIPIQLSLSRFGYSPQLFQNVNLMIIINVGFVFVALILYIIKMKVDFPHSQRLEKIYTYIQHEIVPTLILFSLINLSFSVGQTGYVFTTVDSDLFIASNQASNLSLLFFYFLNIIVFCQYYRIDRDSLLSWRRQYKQTKGSQIHFLIWIMYKSSLGFIIGLAHAYTNSLIALIIFTVLYSIFTCIVRPFKTVLLLIYHLYSQIVLLYLFIILLVYKSGSISELSISGIIPSLILIGFMVIGLIFMLMYTGYSLHKNIKYWMKKTPMTKMQNIQRKQDMREQNETYNQIKQIRQTRLRRAASINIKRLHRYNDTSSNQLDQMDFQII